MQFTTDNTEGYTAEQPAELNRRYAAAVITLDPESPLFDDEAQNLAERLLAEFDSETR